jgi:hypothetical protein
MVVYTISMRVELGFGEVLMEAELKRALHPRQYSPMMALPAFAGVAMCGVEGAGDLLIVIIIITTPVGSSSAVNGPLGLMTICCNPLHVLGSASSTSQLDSWRARSCGGTNIVTN